MSRLVPRMPARPELILDDELERAAVDRLRADLQNGAWDERHGHHRNLEALDIGVRLISGGPEKVLVEGGQR